MLLDPNEELEVQFVSESIIREAFNSGQFWERARRGEFLVEIDRNSHLKRGRARDVGQQYCTRSQFVLYFDEDGLVAAMHQYRRLDGTLGASGMPDPKYLRLEDRILKTND